VQIERGHTSSSCDLVKFRSTEIEREIGDSGTWVILTIARSIFLESFRAFGGHLHQGLNQLGFQSSSGAPHSVGNSDLRRLRGSLEIQAPGLFLSLPDLYSWRVSEHLEAIFIRAEPARVSVIQWGSPFSGKFRSTEIERDLGDSGTWVILTITRSISWHIY
jgi:hypothetical protein